MAAETEAAAPRKPDRIALTVDIVSAYLTRNAVPAPDVPILLSGVHAKLAALDARVAPTTAPVLTPAQVRRSIRPDALISFIDGTPYKTLKRHLTAHGLDPDAYRERFGLPHDYPMVAPDYAARRSALARDVGFGRWRRERTRSGRPAEHFPAKPRLVSP